MISGERELCTSSSFHPAPGVPGIYSLGSVENSFTISKVSRPLYFDVCSCTTHTLMKTSFCRNVGFGIFPWCLRAKFQIPPSTTVLGRFHILLCLSQNPLYLKLPTSTTQDYRGVNSPLFPPNTAVF